MLVCAVMFAVQILVVGHFAADVDAVRLNCIQAGVCAIASAVVTAFTEEVHITNLLNCWLPLCYAGLLSMGAAYSLQIIGQKNVEPTAASLIMSLESVFAALFGWLLLKETMSLTEISGCILMFTAVILSQIPVKLRRRH